MACSSSATALFTVSNINCLALCTTLMFAYRETARNGHFGRERAEFSWEKTDKAEALKKAAGV